MVGRPRWSDLDTTTSWKNETKGDPAPLNLRRKLYIRLLNMPRQSREKTADCTKPHLVAETKRRSKGGKTSKN